MDKKILLVDSNAVFTYVCSIENGILKEFYSETPDSNQITGNVYKGRVNDVVDGLQSAFVDIGLQRTGFWYIGDTLVHPTILSSNNVLPHAIQAKSGDYVMVQAIKEGTDLKGPKLTSNISIPGHYLIYLYNLDFSGVSNKITDPQTRDRLTSFVRSLAPEGRGFIARTSCLYASEEQIKREAESLIKAGEELQEKWENAEGVGLLRDDGTLLYRSIRDMLSDDTDLIVCNDRNLTEGISSMVKTLCPYFAGRIELYDREEDIFDYYNISDDIWTLTMPRVNLPFGGFIVIEKTEALTTIDVNTGKYIGSVDREDTVFRTNMLATKEIARQIRLRNIGGIIVIDFIDMEVEEHKQAVVQALKAELFHDRVKTRVLEMSGLGLVEVSRKKMGKEIEMVSSSKCPLCGGSGLVINDESLARGLKFSLKKLFTESAANNVYVKVRPEFAEYILKMNIFTREVETVWAGKRIYLELSDSVKMGTFDIETEEDPTLKAILLQ